MGSDDSLRGKSPTQDGVRFAPLEAARLGVVACSLRQTSPKGFLILEKAHLHSSITTGALTFNTLLHGPPTMKLFFKLLVFANSAATYCYAFSQAPEGSPSNPLSHDS